MHQITEIPAWDTRGQPEVLVTKCTSIKVLEENDRLKISSNYPTGNNISLYLSIDALNELFKKLPNKFRSSLIEGFVPTKRKLLVAFLIADKRYSCCFLRKGGYTHILKPGHSLHGKYQSTKNCTRMYP